MKIMVCGSMKFAKQIVETRKKLEAMGHETLADCDVAKVAKGEYDPDDLETDCKNCIDNQVLRRCFTAIEKSDAIIVLNYEKNKIPGYVGASTLIEMGVAHYLGKKIFLLNPPADMHKDRSALEVRICCPLVLNGDLSKIK